MIISLFSFSIVYGYVRKFCNIFVLLINGVKLFISRRVLNTTFCHCVSFFRGKKFNFLGLDKFLLNLKKGSIFFYNILKVLHNLVASIYLQVLVPVYLWVGLITRPGKFYIINFFLFLAV